MKRDTKILKSRAEESLDNKREPRIPTKTVIVKNTKSFLFGLALGFIICLVLLPILGYYPTMKDSVISALVSGIITLLFTNYTTKK